MNQNLMYKIVKLLYCIEQGDFFKAIELNKEITKILNTYKESC